MSRFFSELLAAPEPQFSKSLQSLEKSCGRPGVDVRLQSEIIGARLEKMRDLDLDPNDTTGPELYASLIGRAKEHDQALRDRLRIDSATSQSDVLRMVADYIGHSQIPKSVWVIRKSVAKALLKVRPPKKVMQALGYRSLDSMLKAEDVGTLFVLVRCLESNTWQKGLLARYKTLRPTDFEQRDVRIVVLPEHIVAKNLIIRAKEVGTIGLVVPPTPVHSGFTLAVALLVLHCIAELRMQSSYSKLRQVHATFGKQYAAHVQDDPLHVAELAGIPIHWRTIQRFYSTKPTRHPDFFAPHVQPEDIAWREVEAVAAELLPELVWWRGLAHIGAHYDRQTISFNVLDVATDASRNAPYTYRTHMYFEEALASEIMLRYVSEQSLLTQLEQQFETEFVPPTKHPRRKKVMPL